MNPYDSMRTNLEGVPQKQNIRYKKNVIHMLNSEIIVIKFSPASLKKLRQHVSHSLKHDNSQSNINRINRSMRTS